MQFSYAFATGFLQKTYIGPFYQDNKKDANNLKFIRLSFKHQTSLLPDNSYVLRQDYEIEQESISAHSNMLKRCQTRLKYDVGPFKKVVQKLCFLCFKFFQVLSQ